MSSNNYDYGACMDYTEHQAPQQIDAHHWRCELCGTEWTEGADVEVDAEPMRAGVRVTIGTADFELDTDTAHALIDRIQEALRRSARGESEI